MAKHSSDKPPRELTVSERFSHTKFIVEAGRHVWISPGHSTFALQAGLKLRFSEEAIATAAVFYHTFCSAMNAREHDHTVSPAHSHQSTAQGREHIRGSFATTRCVYIVSSLTVTVCVCVYL